MTSTCHHDAGKRGWPQHAAARSHYAKVLENGKLIIVTRDFNNFLFFNTVPQSTHVADHVLPPHRHPLVDTHDAVTASPREQYKIHYTQFLGGNRIRGSCR